MPEPGSLRSRIQSVLKDKNSTPRGVSVKTGKLQIPRSTTPKSRENVKPVGRAAATPMRIVVDEHTATPKTLQPTSTKRVNLKVSPDHPDLFCLSTELESPRYLSSPKEDDSFSEKETIVSVLNSAVPSPEKPSKDLEATIKRMLQWEHVRLVPRAFPSAQPPTTLLVLQGKDCFLYDILPSPSPY